MLTVYIIDDDADVRTSLSRFLRSLGFAVETFASASDYLDSEPPAHPACLLLDLHMPGMTGLELLIRLTGSERNLPAIVMTGGADDETERRALCAGALAILRKPLELRALLEAFTARWPVTSASPCSSRSSGGRSESEPPPALTCCGTMSIWDS